MSRFEDDRFRAMLATILDETVLRHYPEAGLLLRLQLFIGDVRSVQDDKALVDLVIEAAEQLEAGDLQSNSEFLAAAAIRIAHQQHRHYCDFDGKAACWRDIRAANDLLDALAHWMCSSRLDGDDEAETPILDDAASACITDRGGDDGVPALARHLFSRTRPKGDERTLRPIAADRPIIQLNAAITRMPWQCYEEIKTLTAKLEDSLSDTYEVECTSQYVTPLQPAPPNDLLTRAGVLRSSGMVVFSEHGRIGTGRTLEMADLMMIPVLILQRVDAEHETKPLAVRFRGGISSEAETYGTDDQAIAKILKFLRVNEFAIYQRAEDLADWDQRGRSEAHRIASELKDAWPTGAQMDHETVVWWLESVHWAQAPANVRDAVMNLITFVRSSASGRTADLVNRASPAMRRSRETLGVYRRKSGLSPKRVTALWHAYLHRLAQTPALSSPRDETAAWEYTDWEQLDGQLDDL